MKGSQQDGRHLTREGLETYLSAGVSAALKIEGAPVVYVIIEPAGGTVALRAPFASRSDPDLAGYRHISTSTVQWNDRPWHELRVAGAPLVETYRVLCGIADRMQLGGQAFSPAVRDSLAALRQLFAQTTRLSNEQEVGLFGELFVLRHLIARMDGRAAVECWRGPYGEEHDFDIDGADVEVKATLSENRRHWIGHLGQLQPTLDRALWLVSIQLTAAADGGAALPEFIGAIRTSLSAEGALDAFDRRLDVIGWRNEDAESYRRRLRLRSRPALFAVDASFPALTKARLAAAALDAVRFPEVRYTIDLDGLSPATAGPASLIEFCLGAER